MTPTTVTAVAIVNPSAVPVVVSITVWDSNGNVVEFLGQPGGQQQDGHAVALASGISRRGGQARFSAIFGSRGECSSAGIALQ